MWPVFAAERGNFTLAPFAHHGATCLDVVASQLPMFDAARANGSLGTLAPDETAYTLWIGTNDVGPSNLLVGKTRAGLETLVDAVNCAVGWVQTTTSRPFQWKPSGTTRGLPSRPL